MLNKSFFIAHVDFSIPNYELLGDWKIGSGCTETKDTGPCSDLSFAMKPGKMLQNLNKFIHSSEFYVRGNAQTSFTHKMLWCTYDLLYIILWLIKA